MKALNILQIIAKVAKVLCSIVYIMSIVSISLCMVGIITLIFFPSFATIEINGLTIQAIIQNNTDLTIPAMYFLLIDGIIVSGCQLFLSNTAKKYFINVLAVGHPFTKEGAKELFDLGIYTIVIPLGCLIIASIVFEIFSAVNPDFYKFNGEHYLSVGLGIAFIVCSLIFKAAVEEKTENK